MADMLPNSFLVNIANGTLDLDSNNIYGMILTNAYVPNAAHATRADLTNEAVGTGYTAGGQALANKTVTQSGATSIFDADDLVWAAATLSGQYCALYKNNGGAAAGDPLVVILDIGATTSTNAPFTVQFNAGGILVFAKG